MQDSSKSGHYFLKTKVWASYTSEVYDVTATLSQHSGFVRDASCTCHASAMGRCSHVTGLLYALVDYIDTCDTLKVDPQSCNLFLVLGTKAESQTSCLKKCKSQLTQVQRREKYMIL